MSGALSVLRKNDDIRFGVCFPIVDKQRMRDGVLSGINYYSFEFTPHEQILSNDLIMRFEKIIEEFQPDVIHIWGTEFVHSLAMLLAAENKGLIENVIVYIQGLVSVYSNHFMIGIPQCEIDRRGLFNRSTIKDDIEDFVLRGQNEISLLKKARHIAGRTAWDKACAFHINDLAEYHYMPDILRDIFYKKSGIWTFDDCVKHRIFISQGHYPVKGLHLMLEAMQLIVKKYPNAELYIGGISPVEENKCGQMSQYGELISKKIDEYGLSSKVIFLGKLDEIEMINEYKKANVVVSCSTIENASNSICEAMMVGAPVVTSFVGGVANLISHQESGLLYDVNAPYMLAYYVCNLFKDEIMCEKLSKNGVEKIGHLLDRRSTGKIIKDVYKKIAKA